jgi:hypothetical protein
MFLRIKLTLSAIVLLLLSGCVENKNTLESETSAIKQLAYEINYQLVQESKRLKSLVDEGVNDKREDYSVNELFSYFNINGDLNYPSNWDEVPQKLGRENLRNTYEKSKLTSSLMVVSPQKGVLIYPKLNRVFQKIEKGCIAHILNEANNSKETPSGNWVTTPYWSPVESGWLMSCIVPSNDMYLQLNIPVQTIKEKYLDKQSGYYFIMDPEGRLISLRENTETIIAVDTETQKMIKNSFEFPESRNIYRSKNQGFKEACRKILTDGEKKVRFNWNGSDYMLLNAEISELKWQLVQVIKL